MTDETGACPRSVRYTPTDGETGRPHPEQHVRCTLIAGHAGFHMGDDRMPFGPWIEPNNPPGSHSTTGGPE